jgi:hypothetical protein
MTKSWLVSFARAARPRERNARRLARQQPVYVYGGDLVGAARMRWWFFTIAGRPHGTDSFVEFASRRRPI